MSEEQRKYFKKADGNSVEFWSTVRLPWQQTKELPKNELDKMRDYLSSAIKNLTNEDNKILNAVYRSIQEEDIDIDNVLFYNVYPSTFNDLFNKGVRFEQWILPPPEVQIKLDGKAKYYHHYTFDDIASHWKKEQCLAFWNNIPYTMNEKHEAYFVWNAMKNGSVEVINKLSHPQSYYIKIKISVPTEIKINLSSFLKPLLDGVISSFHRHKGADLIKIANRLAEILGDNRSNVEQMLMDSHMNVLGSINLLHLHGQTLQWNPADHCCMKAEVLIDNTEDSTLYLSGELYSIK